MKGCTSGSNPFGIKSLEGWKRAGGFIVIEAVKKTEQCVFGDWREKIQHSVMACLYWISATLLRLRENGEYCLFKILFKLAQTKLWRVPFRGAAAMFGFLTCSEQEVHTVNSGAAVLTRLAPKLGGTTMKGS